MKRFDIINALIKKHSYTNYLEIGVQDKVCFDKIQCLTKSSVDPDINANADFIMTSDDFFNQCSIKFDIIFIDGDHTSQQVEKDILNSLKFLEENGTIICHDMNPTSFKMQKVPRVQSEWTGNCYKAWIKLKSTRGDLIMSVVNTDYGVGIIQRGNVEFLPTKFEIDELLKKVEEEDFYYYFEKYKKTLLNLISEFEFTLSLK